MCKTSSISRLQRSVMPSMLVNFELCITQFQLAKHFWKFSIIIMFCTIMPAFLTICMAFQNLRWQMVLTKCEKMSCCLTFSSTFYIPSITLITCLFQELDYFSLNYAGLSKLRRLLFIAKHCPSLELDALK